ncbi:MAG: nucleotide sugar dehydrogenase [Chloroflexi bacterium]|nr:nucleotide sugar dehydrogenase [Ardenticatenaceae bacterium]MBL1127652.1 nucleotide sugar dehydrogenase [Chloroflexota bacterium]NOG33717.1 nucleotide sugar dehydrogenase [Chloroflexota bacterium]GIK56038.1 MAG: UDP-N-acetyl-D-glucosamine dehydrogenase [Chloroflexota bacterium]
MNVKAELLQKIADRQAKIAVIGMGYVGLPLMVAFAEAGFPVVGVDVDHQKVERLNRGESYIEDVTDDVLRPLLQKGLLWASSDYAAVAGVDAISICVPTPLRKTKDPDISYIINAADNIAAHDGAGKLIVLESTTYPGTTEEVILPRLAENGQQVGRDFFLAFSPERIDPGRSDYNVWTTPKVIGGMTPDCLEVSLALYGTIVEKPVPVSSPAAAEMVKLLENTFRAVNIGLVNEVALMCDKLGLNVWEVVDAAATKPYGFMKFTPGPGLGGHCIPIDPHYLSWKLKTLNYTARFIELAAEVNGYMPEYVVSKVAAALNGERKAVNGSHILVLGVAYKPNVSDMRESPALDIIHLLQARGAAVTYHDPFVPDLTHEGFDLQSVALTPAALRAADCVVIVTDHRDIDWRCVAEESAVLVDARNALKELPGNGRVVSL